MSSGTSLEGSLELFKLPEILQVIAQQQKTGILTVQGQDDIFAISFHQGDVVAADSLNQAGDEALFNLLERDRILDSEVLESVREIVENDGERLVDVLEQEGHLERDSILSALRNQYLDLLGALLSWTSGDFKFYSNNEVAFEEGLRPIRVQDVLLDSMAEDDPAPADEDRSRSGGEDLSKLAADSQPQSLEADLLPPLEAPQQGAVLPDPDSSLLSLDESLLATTTFDGEGSSPGGSAMGEDTSSAPRSEDPVDSAPLQKELRTELQQEPSDSEAESRGGDRSSRGGTSLADESLSRVLHSLSPAKPLEVRTGESPGVRSDVVVINPAHQQVLSRVDGQRTLQQIAHDCGLEDGEAVVLLEQLQRLRLVRAEAVSLDDMFDSSPAVIAEIPDEIEGAGRGSTVEWGKVASWAGIVVSLAALVALGLGVSSSPGQFLLPFPWQGELQHEAAEVSRESAYREIDRAAKTYYLVHGAFPESLEILTEAQLLSPGALRAPSGRQLSYLSDDVTYGVAPVERGQLLEGMATTGGVGGSFLLDLDFYSLQARERSTPLVLLD